MDISNEKKRHFEYNSTWRPYKVYVKPIVYDKLFELSASEGGISAVLSDFMMKFICGKKFVYQSILNDDKIDGFANKLINIYLDSRSYELFCAKCSEYGIPPMAMLRYLLSDYVKPYIVDKEQEN